ncbi:TetR/AcrR family transcriptional regulator [Chitinimonas sp.]|uniref:TetR/AcrR family transcriptional regulator n=1 Tax=Chitinimonas sp. TaxID=1934313 RepID=UPI0035B06581
MHNSQRLTDRKRAAIIHAATEAFRSGGFNATSMDQVAASAGVSKRTVYNHFPSKEALFAEILLQLWQSSTAQDEAAYDGKLALRPQLLALLQQKMQMLTEPDFIALARVALAETLQSPERARDMLARLGEREEGVIVWLRAALADGRLKSLDPVLAGHQLLGQLKALAFWPQIAMGKPQLAPSEQAQLVASAVDMFLAFYAQETPA